MAVAAEQTFQAAVAAAEGVRQGSKAAAFTTWAYGTGATLTTYQTALSDADAVYFNAVKVALDASNLTLGLAGMQGPIASSNWAPISSIA